VTHTDVQRGSTEAEIVGLDRLDVRLRLPPKTRTSPGGGKSSRTGIHLPDGGVELQ